VLGRRLVLIGFVSLAAVPIGWATGAAAPIPPIDGAEGTATATLSDPAAGASSALTIRLSAELQCGRLVAATVAIRLPDGMHVPTAIAPSAVRLGGRPATRVQTSGSRIVASLSLQKGAICDVIGPGEFPIVLTRAAGLRNPSASGAYAFTVSVSPRARTWRGTLSVA